MQLSLNAIRENARKFSLEWKNETKERAESQTFWNEFFAVFGVNRRKVGTFEAAFKNLKGAQGYIDVYWPKKLVCEQKSRGEDLAKASEQALGYLQSIAKVAEDNLPRYVIVCDFERLHLLDLETQQEQKILIANLADNIELFGFISGYETQFRKEQEIVNIAAALRMGKLHDQLKENGYDGHDLRVMLIRLLFCLFAEDTHIFNKNQFHNFLLQRTREDGSDLAAWISQLFDTLDREVRLKNLDEQLNAFAYINGELFKEVIRPAAFDSKMREELIKACETDWQTISPEIFGALFQSVMDKEERRYLGAHYTSESNILKLINSLFLNDLKEDLALIKAKKQVNVRAAELNSFHDKLASLTFLDPACGCGNFLVVAYRELRLLELEIIEQKKQDSMQLEMDVSALVRCNVNQFYGIEIEEFPAQIARVAMWLVDHQMNLLLSNLFGMHYARIPLKQSAIISHANALEIDWPVTHYILGNPPFIGARLIDRTQRISFDTVMSIVPKSGLLDFVAAWYVKAAQMINANPEVRCAFVSTSSITQGEQVGVLWPWIFSQGMCIQFAHRTFFWQSAAKGRAAVHCVIIGFGKDNTRKKMIFDYETITIKDVDKKDQKIVHITQTQAANINAYLVDAANIFLENRTKPICVVMKVVFGSMPNDGGHLLINDEATHTKICQQEPNISKYILPFLGADEFINGKKRWCLWLNDCSPKELRGITTVKERVLSVRAYRQDSTRLATQRLADTPHLFGEIRQPKSEYILIPRHSSENRKYIPLGFLPSDVICGDANLLIPKGDLYTFAIMTSIMHNAWMRAVCGRLESRYRYSVGIVYNNFPWPSSPTTKQIKDIEIAAQSVLDARLAHPESSLADLYDPDLMPKNLREAHKKLDASVDAAYGKTKFFNEAERVAFLFELYQQYTTPIAPVTKSAKSKK